MFTRFGTSGDKDAVEKIKSTIYPYALVDEMRAPKTEITRLTAKNKIIEELQVRVSKLEVSVDDTEQYSRRANVRIQGIHDTGASEDARATVLQVINETMKMSRLCPTKTSNCVFVLGATTPCVLGR